MLPIVKYSSTLLRRNRVRQQNPLRHERQYLQEKKTGPYEIRISGAANLVVAEGLQSK